MRRILLVLSVAAVMAMMVAAMAVPAFADNPFGHAQGTTKGEAETSGYGSYGSGGGEVIDCGGIRFQSDFHGRPNAGGNCA